MAIWPRADMVMNSNQYSQFKLEWDEILYGWIFCLTTWVTADCTSCSRCSLRINRRSFSPSCWGVRSDMIKPNKQVRMAASFHNKAKARHQWQPLPLCFNKQIWFSGAHFLPASLHSHTWTHTSRNTLGSITVPVWRPSTERCGLRWKEKNSVSRPRLR